MRQMYKIYINQSHLILCSLEAYQELDKGRYALMFQYSGNKKRLHNVIDLLEKSPKKQGTVIYAADLPKLWSDFKSIQQVKKAAGGVVINEFGELLVIFRRGLWDLPKGHIEPGEKKKETAIREVEEECGIRELTISKKLGKTYHIYRIKGRKILKKSFWYQMSTHKQITTPETREDIEIAKWIDPDKFLEEYDMYGNIRNILHLHFDKTLNPT